MYYTFLVKRTSEEYKRDQYEILEIIGTVGNSPVDAKPGDLLDTRSINNMSANGHIINIYPHRANQGYDFTESQTHNTFVKENA
jgi:hypothetical protein